MVDPTSSRAAFSLSARASGSHWSSPLLLLTLAEKRVGNQILSVS